MGDTNAYLLVRDATDHEDHEELPTMFPRDRGDGRVLDDGILHWRDNQNSR